MPLSALIPAPVRITMLRISVISTMKQQIQGYATMAKIGIIGSKGRMGNALVSAIEEAGQTVAGGVDKGDDLSTLVAASDVLVDFSSPHALEANLAACVAAQKPIVIGKGGEMIKRIGTKARLEIEELIGRHVYLSLHVKVKPHWMKAEGLLKQAGFPHVPAQDKKEGR
jgi:hypothetical protein